MVYRDRDTYEYYTYDDVVAQWEEYALCGGFRRLHCFIEDYFIVQQEESSDD